jgi:hypothetical protein
MNSTKGKSAMGATTHSTGPRPPAPGGIYFLIPFPEGWEVCAFRFSLYPDSGHSFFWEQAVAPLLALRWARQRHAAADLDRQPALIVALKRRLAGLYDAVPRGRAQPPLGTPGRCVVHHGNDLTPDLGLTRQDILKSLGLRADTRWVFDGHETMNPDSVRQLQRLLGLSLPVGPKS